MWYALVFCLSAREKLDRFARDLGTAYVDLWRLSGVEITYYLALNSVTRLAARWNRREHVVRGRRVGRHRMPGRVSWWAERRMHQTNERSRGNKVAYDALMASIRIELPQALDLRRREQANGSASYLRLRPAVLDADVDALFADLTSRTPIVFEDVTDEAYAAVMADA